jgi:ATP-dependent helicase/nuclease subunit A
MSLHVITASAGTGKTHRLGVIVCEALARAERNVAPEEVMAITFTRAAAAELVSRVRRMLLTDGKPLVAQRLAAARMGTVHAVLKHILDEHAFLLGLTPGLRVIDEHMAARAYAEALSQAVEGEWLVQAADLQRRCPSFDVMREAMILHNTATMHGMNDATMMRSHEESVNHLRHVLSARGATEHMDAQWRTGLHAILARHKTTSPAASHARVVLDGLGQYHDVPWASLRMLENHAAKEHKPAFCAHIEHPRFVEDVVTAVDLSFRAARAGAARYRDDKRAWGVLDFDDLENFSRTLLTLPEAQAWIRSSIRLMVVDEFQDTSPAQLAIFVQLASLVESCVFVGDEKQSIYGFRGAQPSTLEQTLATIHHTKETLLVARRQRPQMVRALSAMFGRAFATHGGAMGSVDMQPVHHSEAIDLGVDVERWHNAQTESEPYVVAAGVAECLREGVTMVRARHDDGVRPVQPHEIGVLCQTRAHARKVAAALRSWGIKVQGRDGRLCDSVAAHCIEAALGVWQDPRDDAAAIHLHRLLRHSATPDAWLASLPLEQEDRLARVDSLWPQLRSAAMSNRQAGVVAAFESVVHVLQLPTQLRMQAGHDDWVRDLSLLRSLVERVVQHEEQRGRSATIDGFLRELAAQRDMDTDQETMHSDDDPSAVEVCTWHAAKGREWPVVVLCQLSRVPLDGSVGAIVDTQDVTIEQRSIRYVPNPYSKEPWKTDGAYFDRLRSTREHAGQKRDQDREELRRLYVALTRARDHVVVVGERNVWTQGAMRLLTDDHGPLLREQGGELLCANVPLRLRVRDPQAKPVATRERALRVPPPPRTDHDEHVPAFGAPSAHEGVGTALRMVSLGDSFFLRNVKNEREDLNRLGRCLHAFFAVDLLDADDDRGLTGAGLHLRRYRCSDMIDASSLHAMSRRLRAHFAREHAHAQWRTEVPLTHRPSAKTTWRGQIDVLLEVPTGCIIIDHKTTLNDDVTAYGGQLAIYARAVAALSGKPVQACIIYLPVQSQLVWLAPSPLAAD